MLGDAGNIELTVGEMVADVLAGVAHAVIQRRIKRLVNGLHPSQQQLFKQVYRQQFSVATTSLPRVNTEASLETCIETLLQAKTRYLLAFEPDNTFAGVITIHDLLRQVLATKDAAFNASAAQQLIDHDEKGLIY